MSQQILDLLAKSSAQKPMSFDVLLTECGLLPKTLNMILDSMYAAHSINQATVTRKGVEQREVWLTGVVEKATRQHIVINKAYTPPSGHQTMPRRDEKPAIKPVEEPPVIAAPSAEIKTEKVIEMNTEAKPKALQMLEQIELYGEIMIKQIQYYLKDKTIGESFIKGYIDDKRVIVSINSLGKKSYSIAPGMKVKDFYGTRAIKQKSAVESEYVSPMKAQVCEIAQTAIEVELPKTQDEPKPVYAWSPSDLTDDDFKVALTNKGTILIFGIGYQLIELNRYQSATLSAFVKESFREA